MIHVRASFIALCASVAVCAACGGPSSYPDGGAVASAQAAWCQAVAKGASLSAEQVATCKGAPAYGWAQYLKGMATCFPKRKEMLGDKAPDNSLIIAQCRDE